MIHPKKKVCACARVPVCTYVRLIILVLVSGIMYHIRTYLVSARYQPATKIRICRYVCAGWGTYYVPHMYVNWCEHVCLYLVSMKSSTEKQSSSAIIVHEAKRTATSTRTIYTRHDKPYRLGAAPAEVVGTPSRCCPAATVPAAVVFACGFRCCFAEIAKKKQNSLLLRCCCC